MAFKIKLYVVFMRLKNCPNRKLDIVDWHSTYSLGNFLELVAAVAGWGVGGEDLFKKFL